MADDNKQKELSIEDMSALRLVFDLAKDHEATDIALLENSVPRLGRLKTYTPVADFPEISAGDIEQFLAVTSPSQNGGHTQGQQAPKKIREYAFSIKSYGRYRVCSARSEQGVTASIRKLPFYIPPLKDVDKRSFLRGLSNVFDGRETGGLVIHTGVTGSGKSTSIASEVDAIARKISGNILTFEEPIEYQYTATKAKVMQFEIPTHVDSYIDGLKMALRSNPSVIVIGEVRLHEEIKTMMDLAIRGHLVFTTLHTSSTMNTLRFLDSISADKDSWRQLIATSLRAVISQRLLYLKDRGFVFIPEVFIPNNMARNKIARGELKELSNAFHTNTMRENGCFTFKDTLSILQQQAIISADDQRAMLDGLVFFE